MISLIVTYAIIYSACLIGLLYAIFNYFSVKSIKIHSLSFSKQSQISKSSEPLIPNPDISESYINIRRNSESIANEAKSLQIQTIIDIGNKIAEGANAFLFKEYKIIGIFCLILALIIKFTVDELDGFGTTTAFILGAFTSVLSGFLGMRIAVFANTRTAFKAQDKLSEAFVVAFRAGCVMGFTLVCLSLFVMTTIIAIYRLLYNENDYKSLYECMAGYGLGGSTIALFGRVGGGIYTKAADVGADIAGKVEGQLKEDDPNNPATIADNVGDNVGDIAGMGADLFGSFAESTCAALVVLSSNPITISPGGYLILPVPQSDSAWMFLPLLLSAFGIFACFITSFFGINIMKVELEEQIERTLKYQIIISTIILLGFLYVASTLSLNISKSTIYINCITPNNTECYELSPENAYLCSASGLLAGMIIGLLTEYYTSNAYSPVKEVAEASNSGSAPNIIYGLALGYLSTVIPVLLLSISAYISHKTLGMLGLALAALGMLSNLCIGLAIDAYGPISDNAGGIAEMSNLDPDVRRKTDALDAAGNTTAAIGKGFAIGSAALVSLSLFGAFITRASSPPLTNPGNAIIIQDSDITITDALVFSGLLIGAMLPYFFSAMTMKAVGKAANQMVEEVRRQLKLILEQKLSVADYATCIRISTEASLKEMIGPGALVIFTPIIIGLLFGPRAIAGLLPGALISGVQMAISSSNTGGAWDNAKKKIEKENAEYLMQNSHLEGEEFYEQEVIRRRKLKDVAVIGDTVGDPLKDTSGPSLNILIKLMAILSLVFTSFFQRTGYLVNLLNEQENYTNPNQPPFDQRQLSRVSLWLQKCKIQRLIGPYR